MPAERTWAAVRALRRMGWTKGAISQVALGNVTASLQLVGRKVLARTEHAVLKLLEKSKALRQQQLEAKKRLKQAKRRCPRCGDNHKDDPTALSWCLANLHVPVGQLETR